ncbi:MAG: hypothetical protein M1365_00275 [Actinobacteria bacterium]|nr:hypothetical protein [Actinomycetota bacterium]
MDSIKKSFVVFVVLMFFLKGWFSFWTSGTHTPFEPEKSFAASLTNSAGTVVGYDDSGTGCRNTGGNWVNPTNSTSSNNLYASYGGSYFDNNEISDELQSSNFGFSIPNGATIDGIVVEIEKHSASGDNAVDYDVRLTKSAGVQTGTNKADTTTNWGYADPNSYKTYGSSSDLWGTTWSEAEVENSGFGVVVCAKSNNDTNVDIYIDHVRITVYYTVTNTSPTLSISEPNGTADTVTAGQSYNITYSLADTEEAVTSAFYYDTNNSGLDGTAISGACATAAEGSGATCSWDTTGVTPGSYYVYGITNDGVNPQVSAYSSGQITINPAVSISITSDGSVGFGLTPLNTAKDTTSGGINDPETISIDSGPANLDVKSTLFSQGGNTWSLGSSNGSNQVKWEFSKDGSIWNTFAAVDTNYTFDTNVAQGQTRNLYLRLTTPTSTGSYDQFSATITITASAP